MDLFYFHTKNDEKQQSEEENRNPPLNGCFLVLSASTKQKIKPINVMGISRRFAFIPSPSSLSHFAMSLRFLSFTRFFYFGAKRVLRGWKSSWAFFCLPTTSAAEMDPTPKVHLQYRPQNGIIMWTIMAFIFLFKPLTSTASRNGVNDVTICECTQIKPFPSPSTCFQQIW